MASGIHFLLILVVYTAQCWAQAPGDEADRCTTDHRNPPQYPDTIRMLMDSYSYVNLLPGNGTGSMTPIADAVWNDFSFDGNDVTRTLRPTYWQQGAGGICRFQTTVCGWGASGAVVPQNNWLFTQHISEDFDATTYNYDVAIQVEAIYSLQSCRERQGCKQRFNLLHYMINSQRLPSTSGGGYMNPQNYEVFAVPEGEPSVNNNNTYTFTLPPSSTGFYVAAQDDGSCIALSRLRVYRNSCNSFQTGLVTYPDAPAPVSAKVSVKFLCVSNGEAMGKDTVECRSDGTWVTGSPKCGCRPGYEINQARDGCQICPEGQYQPLLSDTNQCKPCPAQSSARDEGTPICLCDANFIRHPDRPDDPCIRTPTAPLLDLTKPPQLEGNEITVIWTPPSDSGGDPDGLYFNVYAAQLVQGENPTFCRQNKEQIDDSCNAEGSECRYRIESLNANTPYAILVVSGNSVTDDPECLFNVTVLGSRYLVMVVGTEDAVDESALSAEAAAGISFIVTLIVTAVATAVIVTLIIFFCFKRRGSYSSTTTTTQKTHTTTSTSVNMYNLDEKPPAFDGTSADSKPLPAKKPGRPLAPPPKPPVPTRPIPHARPYSPPTHNGY